MSKNSIHHAAVESVPLGNPMSLSSMWWSARHPPADPKVSFAGKTVLVTGANTGLGYDAAKKYAQLGCDRLMLGVRTLEKGELTRDRIIHETGISPDTISIFPVELSSFESVRRFVRDVTSAVDHLDVVLLNAGLAKTAPSPTPEGWDVPLHVNVLSTALMAILLLSKLRVTGTAGRRVNLTFTNSIGHTLATRNMFTGTTLFKAANDAKTWNQLKSYVTTKLLGMAVMKGIARAVTNTNIITNAACPNYTKTELGREAGIIDKMVMSLMYATMARSAEEGARSLVSATCLGDESHGKFWTHDVLYPNECLADDEKLMKESWKEILAILIKSTPEIKEIVSV